jgi:hypothetical protein
MHIIPIFIQVKITFFQAGYSVNTVDLPKGWERLAEMGLDTIEIPGDHASIFNRSNAVVLARELNKCIEKTSIDREIRPD